MASQEGTSKDQTVSLDVDQSLMTGTALDVCDAEPELAAFSAALEQGGMKDQLAGTSLTLFAPNNAALEEANLGDSDQLTETVRRHIMAAPATEAELRSSRVCKTLNGDEFPITRDGTSTKVGRATIVRADLECSNGVVHIIDHLL